MACKYKITFEFKHLKINPYPATIFCPENVHFSHCLHIFQEHFRLDFFMDSIRTKIRMFLWVHIVCLHWIHLKSNGHIHVGPYLLETFLVGSWKVVIIFFRTLGLRRCIHLKNLVFKT